MIRDNFASIVVNVCVCGFWKLYEDLNWFALNRQWIWRRIERIRNDSTDIKARRYYVHGLWAHWTVMIVALCIVCVFRDHWIWKSTVLLFETITQINVAFHEVWISFASNIPADCIRTTKLFMYIDVVVTNTLNCWNNDNN